MTIAIHSCILNSILGLHPAPLHLRVSVTTLSSMALSNWSMAYVASFQLQPHKISLQGDPVMIKTIKGIKFNCLGYLARKIAQ